MLICKTRDWHQLQVHARQLLGKELQGIRKLVRAVPGTVGGAAAAAGQQSGVAAAAPAALQQAHTHVVDTIDLTDE